MTHVLRLGNCLDIMPTLEAGSVDMVLADPPYGTTACKWDSVIPFGPMWEQLKRLIKPNGAIVMTASQPFTTALIASNMKMFKYCWVWEKSRTVGFLNVRNAPMKKHEDIAVFSNGATANRSKRNMPYFPQGISKINKVTKSVSKKGDNVVGTRPSRVNNYTAKQTGFPNSLIRINNETKQIHPTQKPVALMEYLIKTYTNEGETVLDFTMGSGTTGVACMNTGRRFIGIELDADYFGIASRRIADAYGEALAAELGMK